MSELTKKIAAIALTFALAFSVMGLNVTVADEHDDDDVTAEELLTQIQGLQQLIAQLQGGQTTTPTTPTAPTTGTPAACAAVTSFARNLTLGSSGADVKCLQALLNADPVTQVAASGVGSAGQESEYFGPLTRAAVISFQNKYSSEVLAPVGLNAGTGFVGAQTRAKLNTMLTAGVPGMPGVPTAPDFMTQLQAIADALDAITLRVQALEGTDWVDDEYEGVEGELEVKTNVTPATGVEVAWNAENTSVMGIELKAKNSPIKVNRIDLRFDKNRPWDYVNYVTLYDGDDALQGKSVSSANTTEITSGGHRRMRFSGLNIVVPADGTKVVTVKVNTDPRPRETGNVQVYLNAEDVRGVDGAGLTQLSSGTASRTFSIDGSAEGSRIEVKLHANTPAEGVAQTDASETTDHEVLRFDLKATKNAATVKTLTVDAVTTTGSMANVQSLWLYDGDTLLASEDAATTSATLTVKFEDFELDIAKDATKTLRVEARYAATTSTGDIKVSYNTLTGDSANDEALTQTGSANGNTIYFYDKFVTVSNVTIPALAVTTHDATTTRMEGTIQFDLTAVGGDVTLSTTTLLFHFYDGDAAIVSGTATSSLVDGSTLTSVTITEGQKKTFKFELAKTDGTPGTRYLVAMTQVGWTGGSLPGELIKLLKTGSKVW